MFNSDLPIEKVNDDVLGRSGFAKSLAQTMLDYNAPEGFAIGVYGKWGSGKTSVVNMVLEQIDQLSDDEQKPIVLRFNPWLFSDPKQLISQFFKQLSVAIKMKQPNLDKVWGAVNDYAGLFDIAKFIPIAGGFVSPVAKVLEKKAKSRSEKNNDLQKIKDEIIEVLRKEKVKIIVTIDDIDRLSSKEIASVFQLVKSLADFPYTMYLLAFDRSVVVEALNDVQKGGGAEYLEKIVQVPFELPVPDAEGIYKTLFAKLDSIISTTEEEWDEEYWGEMFHNGIKPYLTSIRDVVRFANTFALKYASLKDETNTIDLLGLTCLQVFEAEVYSSLPSYKEDLCGGFGFSSREEDKEKVKKIFDILVEEIPKERIENAKNILLRLFPKLSNALNKIMYGNIYNHYSTLNNGNISNLECFNRYFSLSLEFGSIPSQAIKYLLFNASTEEFAEKLKDMNAKNKTTRLLEHITGAFEPLKDNSYVNSERAELILKCLFLHWHELEDEDISFYSISLNIRLLLTASVLIKAIDTSRRYIVLSSLFNDDNVDVSTIGIITQSFEEEHNRIVNKSPSVHEPTIPIEELLKLEETFVSRVIQEFESESLLNNDSATKIIWLFEQIDESKAKEFTDKMITTDLSLANFISAAVCCGTSSDLLSGRTHKFWSIRKDSINKYIDIDSAYESMSTFVHSNEFKELPESKRENISVFLICVEKQADVDSLEGSITIEEIKEKLDEINRL